VSAGRFTDVRALTIPLLLFALPACPVVDGNPDDAGEGEGEGEGEDEGEAVDPGDCFPDVFQPPLSTAPVVIYVDGFDTGIGGGCAAGLNLHEVYFELDPEVPFTAVAASFSGEAAVVVTALRADAAGHRGDVCVAPGAPGRQVGVQVTGEGGPSVAVCGTVF
jgi:hypothetical protein